MTILMRCVLRTLSLGVHSADTEGSGSCLAPKLCMISCKILRTPIHKGIRSWLALFRLTNKALNEYSPPFAFIFTLQRFNDNISSGVTEDGGMSERIMGSTMFGTGENADLF